jgi:hypothetical protein
MNLELIARYIPNRYQSAHFKMGNRLAMHADLYDLPDLKDNAVLQLAERGQLLTFAVLLALSFSSLLPFQPSDGSILL